MAAAPDDLGVEGGGQRVQTRAIGRGDPEAEERLSGCVVAEGIDDRERCLARQASPRQNGPHRASEGAVLLEVGPVGGRRDRERAVERGEGDESDEGTNIDGGLLRGGAALGAVIVTRQ